MNNIKIIATIGKLPDRVTLVPGECSKCAVWNFTCPDTLAPSYRALAVSALGSVAAQAEMKKIAKYSSLNSTLYSFIPVAIESLGTFSVRTLKFNRDLGRRIAIQSSDSLAIPYLIQCLASLSREGIIGTIGL